MIFYQDSVLVYNSTVVNCSYLSNWIHIITTSSELFNFVFSPIPSILQPKEMSIGKNCLVILMYAVNNCFEGMDIIVYKWYNGFQIP